MLSSVHVHIHVISLIKLKLFDSTSNSIITWLLELPVLFLTGESMSINFYVTPLDPLIGLVSAYARILQFQPIIFAY